MGVHLGIPIVSSLSVDDDGVCRICEKGSESLFVCHTGYNNYCVTNSTQLKGILRLSCHKDRNSRSN
jgi:hypothetical protein